VNDDILLCEPLLTCDSRFHQHFACRKLDDTAVNCLIASISAAHGISNNLVIHDGSVG